MTVWSRTRAFAVSRATETISCGLLALIAAEPGLLTNCLPEGIPCLPNQANAAMRSIVHRDTGETYREMLTHVRLSPRLLVKPAGKAEHSKYIS